MYFHFGFFIFFSCALNSGYAHKNFRLNDTLHGGIKCDNDYQCQYFIQNSKCIKNLCKCTEDLLLSSDGSKCLETVEGYGSPCEDNVQCSRELYAGGICENGICICKKGYHYLKGYCWKDSDLREKCIANEQCFSAYEYIGLECDGGVCKCREHYYERSHSGCRRKRRIDESCNIDKDCVDGTTCDKMTCTKVQENENPNPTSNPNESSTNVTFETIRTSSICPKGMFELKGTCVLELGMSCRSESECSHIPKAHCLDGTVCGCEPATYIASENNRQCLRVSRGKTENIRSSSCKRHPECGVFGGNSFCENRRCACNNESYWETENSVCWPIKKIGESCTSRTDCHPSVTNADCVGNVCVCKTGFHPKDFICEPDALEVGAACEDDDECLFSNSFCNSSNVCACIERHYSENGKCFPGVETKCATQNDCAHLRNTECNMGNLTEKQCLCLENHTSSEDYRYCLPVKNFKESCTETFQCVPQLGSFGECKDDICQCRQKAHYSYKKCYLSKFIGERCTRLGECFPGDDTNSVICLNGYCSCNYDYKVNENGICVRTSSGSLHTAYAVLMVPFLILSTFS